MSVASMSEHWSRKRNFIFDETFHNKLGCKPIAFKFPHMPVELDEELLFSTSDESTGPTGCQILDILEGVNTFSENITVSWYKPPVFDPIILFDDADEEKVKKLLENAEEEQENDDDDEEYQDEEEDHLEEKEEQEKEIVQPRKKRVFVPRPPSRIAGIGPNARVTLMIKRRSDIRKKFPGFDIFPFGIIDHYCSDRRVAICDEERCIEPGCIAFARIYVCHCCTRQMCAEHALYNFVISWFVNQCGDCRGNRDKLYMPIYKAEIEFDINTSPSVRAFVEIKKSLQSLMTRKELKSTESQFRQINGLIGFYY